MRHKKCQKIAEILKFDDFLELTLCQPGGVPRPKKEHFNAKIDDFYIKNPARAPQLEARSGNDPTRDVM